MTREIRNVYYGKDVILMKRFENQLLDKNDYKNVERWACITRVVLFPIYVTIKIVDKLNGKKES